MKMFTKKPIQEDVLNHIVEFSNGKTMTLRAIVQEYEKLNDKWITIHPPKGDKEDKGIPLKIGDDGTVKAGAGGKFTGKKLSKIRKKSANTPEPTPKEETPKEETPKETKPAQTKLKERLYKIDDDWARLIKDDMEIKKRQEEILKEDEEYKKALDALTKPFADVAAIYRSRRDMEQKALERAAKELGKTYTGEEKADQIRSGEMKKVVDELSGTIKEKIAKRTTEQKELSRKLTSSVPVDNNIENLEKEVADKRAQMEEMKKQGKGMWDTEYLRLVLANKKTLDQIETLKKQRSIRNAGLVSQVFKEKPTKFAVKAKKVAPKIASTWQAAKDAMDGVIGDRWKATEDLNVRHTLRRGHYSSQKEEILSDMDIGTAIHEYAHYLEEKNPEMLVHSLAFLEYRTKGELTLSLRRITKNSRYRSNEKAKADKFFSPYCGKIYNTYNSQEVGGSKASEIMSMGMERLFTDPVGFEKEDPEYFNFVIANMRGEL